MALYSEEGYLQIFIMIQYKIFCHSYLGINKFYSVQQFFRKSKISIFPIVKMASKYAKNDRRGSLEADFQPVPLPFSHGGALLYFRLF